MTSSPAGQASLKIWTEIVHVHETWEEYSYLYGASEERIRMLNSCAGWFFGAVQRLLLRETILGISRLTDPLRIRRRENLVLRRLLRDPVVDASPSVRDKLRKAVKKAHAAARPVRVHRNKYIAHLDYATAMGAPDAPLPGLSRLSISAALAAIEAAYSIYASGVEHVSRSFELRPLGGADALVRILQRSDRWRRLRDLTAPGAA